ncbi:MAG: sulfotransferase [Deltaproteobacteria bacterium]|nr:sulfotransferase [Deltaproteobacteria bacterium]
MSITKSLEEQVLLDEAMANTGLSDFGDDGFREGLGVLLGALEAEANLNEFGRAFAHDVILRHLENRLRVTADLESHPEILDEKIEKPLLVASLPRTGSTIMHHLLGQDSDTRYLATWECNLLSPPPEAATYESDPRIAEWEQVIFGSHGSEAPDFEILHPMGAALPEEHVALLGFDFRSQVFNYQFNVPSYQLWLDEQNLRPVYESFLRLLKYLQWHCRRKRWVVKTIDLHGLSEFLTLCPDAQVVMTHRDPLRAIASLASLLTTGLHMTSDSVDDAAVGRHHADIWVGALRKALDFRDSGVVPETSFFDVHYDEFVKDPVDMIRRIYAYFGLDFTPVVEQRMRDFLASNPKDKLGAHRYTAQQFGLDPVEIKERYQFYIDRFGVECSFDLPER